MTGTGRDIPRRWLDRASMRFMISLPRFRPPSERHECPMRPAILAVAFLAFVTIASAQETPVKTGPRFELRPGERYFREDGRPTFLLGRNPAAMNPEGFEVHFRRAAAAGERLVRIHFTYLPPREKAGEIDAGMWQSGDRSWRRRKSMAWPCCRCWGCGPIGMMAATKKHGTDGIRIPTTSSAAGRRNGPLICSTTPPAASSGCAAWTP